LVPIPSGSVMPARPRSCARSCSASAARAARAAAHAYAARTLTPLAPRGSAPDAYGDRPVISTA
jgi:hypothetical protein